MLRSARHAKILEIIAHKEIETQEELCEELNKQNYKVAQATISRDIKQLHLIKEPIGQGKYRYAISIQRKRLNIADKLRTIFRESISGVDYAQNIVVIKTMSGLASAAATALDSMRLSFVVGSLAGDDTVILIARDTESARELCDEIAEMMK